MVGVAPINIGIVWHTAVAQSDRDLNDLNAPLDLPSSKTGLPVAFGSVLDIYVCSTGHVGLSALH